MRMTSETTEELPSMDIPISIIQPCGPRSVTCSYLGCKANTSSESYTFGIDAVQLSCTVFQRMIDRGWRRAGEYIYKPDLTRSCCPRYAIRLNVVDFKPSRSQRKIVYRFRRFVVGEGAGDQTPSGKAQSDTSFVLLDQIHACETTFHPSLQSKHLFEVTVEPISHTDEKLDLYRRYHASVYNDKSPTQYNRIMCQSPLKGHAIPYCSIENVPSYLPRKYGTYHQTYRLDGILIAIGVIDILPNCVSSFYFVYDPDYECHSLGKLSLLREISLAQEIRQYTNTATQEGQPTDTPSMKYLYMGSYIHLCPKMKYKGEFDPSFLLEPEQYTWHPFNECVPLLDKYLYVPFANPSLATRPIEERDAPEPKAVVVHKPTLSNQALSSLKVIQSTGSDGTLRVVPCTISHYWESNDHRNLIIMTAEELGEQLAGEVIFKMESS